MIKRKLEIEENENKISGEDTILSVRNSDLRVIYHIRFHLVEGTSHNFTNNKKNIIFKTKHDSMWLFKSDVELNIENSIIVDYNKTLPTKQIVIKGIVEDNKHCRKWSLEKI